MDRSRNEPPRAGGGADAPISWSRDRSPPGGSRRLPVDPLPRGGGGPVGSDRVPPPVRVGDTANRDRAVAEAIGREPGATNPGSTADRAGRSPVRSNLPWGSRRLPEVGARVATPPLGEAGFRGPVRFRGRRPVPRAARGVREPVRTSASRYPPPAPANRGTLAPPEELLPVAWIFPRAGPPAPADRERMVRRAGPTAGIIERGEERSPGGSPPRSSAALDGSGG